MKGYVARAVAAEKREALGVHLLGKRLDTGIAHPRRIADHDVETAAGHDVGEVDVEGEESELSILDAVEHAAVLVDARVQLAALREIRLAEAPE